MGIGMCLIINYAHFTATTYTFPIFIVVTDLDVTFRRFTNPVQ